MFTDDEIRYLSEQPLGRLATAQPGGNLQVNPVGYAVNPELGVIDIGGYNMAASRKYRNAADNGRVAFVVDDIASTDPWRVRFLEIRGRAEVIEHPTDSSYEHVPGPIIRIHPRRIISLALSADDLVAEPHEAPMRSRTVGHPTG